MRATSVLLEILRSRLWVVPSIAAVVAAIAAIVVMQLDPGSESGSGLFASDADSARAVLSAIAGAMISLTALVFSITMLVLQRAAAQLSPRVMRTFLRDRSSQLALALFVAAFVFALLILLDVEDVAVSRLGVVMAVALVLVALLAFIGYIDHMAHAIRPISVIRSIGAETREAIDRSVPGAAQREGDGSEPTPAPEDRADPWTSDGQSGLLKWPGPSGYIQAFDEPELLAFAARQGHDLWLRVGVGSFLVHGSPFLAVLGRETPLDEAAHGDVAALVHVGDERTMSQDPEFGIRQLVDIALRALSPSLNDPTTAVEVIDELHDLLRYLVDRPIPSPRALVDADGPVVRVPSPDWDAYVHAAVDPIARAGRAHPEIGRRLEQLLHDLEGDCSAERQPALRRALARIETLEPDAKA